MQDSSIRYLRRGLPLNNQLYEQVKGFDSEFYLAIALPGGGLAGVGAYLYTLNRLYARQSESARCADPIIHLTSLAVAALVIAVSALPAIIVEVIRSSHEEQYSSSLGGIKSLGEGSDSLADQELD